MPLSANCNPDVYISFSALNQQQNHPTKDNYEFASRSLMGEQIVINPTRVGIYTIGVYGDESGPFSILASYGQKPVFAVQQGFFQDFNLQDGEEIYLFYRNPYQIKQKLIFSIAQGIILYFVNSVHNFSDL